MAAIQGRRSRYCVVRPRRSDQGVNLIPTPLRRLPGCCQRRPLSAHERSARVIPGILSLAAGTLSGPSGEHTTADSQHRQPAPAAAPQPTTAARLLHLSDDQHPTPPSLEGLLQRQTSPGQAAHPGGTGPRPTTRQRALGHAPRPPSRPTTTAQTRSRRLTNRIENHLPLRGQFHVPSTNVTENDEFITSPLVAGSKP